MHTCRDLACRKAEAACDLPKEDGAVLCFLDRTRACDDITYETNLGTDSRSVILAGRHTNSSEPLFEASATPYRYTHTGPLDQYDFRRYAYYVLYAPVELQAELLAYQRPRVRITGEIEGILVNLAWQPSGDGRLYLIVSDELRRERNLIVGDLVTIQFNIANPDQVIVPPEFEELLVQDPLYT